MEADWGVFVVNIAEHILIALHIDDCTITGDLSTLIKVFKHEIGLRFRITNLGPINWLLGMKVMRDRQAHTISLSQEPYINGILAKYNFVNMKPVSIPLGPHIQLSEKQSPKTTNKIARMQNIPYCQVIVLLIHLATGTRPDITFATSFVSQFNANPGLEHWEAVKRIYWYLISTKSLALTFGTQMRGLVGYIDADGATQEHRRAITGFAFLVDGGQFSGAQRNKSSSCFLQLNLNTSLLPMLQKKLFGFDDLLVKCSSLSHTRRLFMETIKLPSC